MKIISVNIAKPATFEWMGKQVTTGIYKHPVDGSITLMKTDVKNDYVIDRRYHGGIDKACYLYSTDHYSFWKKQYPDLDWQWGMFGENLTVEGLNESELRIGDEFQIGDTLIQVSQPRQPCFKLGVRFGSQEMVAKFWEATYPGVYVRVIKEGQVKAGDDMVLTRTNKAFLSVADIYSSFTANRKNKVFLQKAINQEYLAASCQKDIRKLFDLLGR